MNMERGIGRNVFLGLLLVFTSAAGAEDIPPASAPEAREDLSLLTLDDAVKEIYANHWKRARKILSAIGPRHRDNPDFFLAYACAQLSGPAGERAARTALTRATKLRKNFARANAALALCNLHLGDEKKARELLMLAERHLFEDNLFLYTRAVAYCQQRKWPEARKAFDALGKKDDPLAALAQKRVKQIDAFWRELGPTEKEMLKKIAVHEKTLQNLKLELEIAKREGRNALADKEILQNSYDRTRRAIQKDYLDRASEIDKLFRVESPDPALQATNPALYDQQLRRAQNNRADRLSVADQYRQQELDRLEKDVRPKAAKIKTEISDLKKKVVTAQRAIKLETPKGPRLLREKKKLLTAEPFELNKHWREVTLWLAAEPLGVGPSKEPKESKKESKVPPNATP